MPAATVRPADPRQAAGESSAGPVGTLGRRWRQRLASASERCSARRSNCSSAVASRSSSISRSATSCADVNHGLAGSPSGCRPHHQNAPRRCAPTSSTSQVLTCERCYADKTAFSWSPQTARARGAPRSSSASTGATAIRSRRCSSTRRSPGCARKSGRSATGSTPSTGDARRRQVGSDRAGEQVLRGVPAAAAAVAAHHRDDHQLSAGRADRARRAGRPDARRPRGDESTKVLIDVKTGRLHPAPA